MPSGKTHDAITLILAVPVFGAVYAAAHSVPLAGVAAAAFLFGGLMFGPDLDTVSKQYSRWWIFRVLWYPYRSFFKHRSRWSHGLVFGTLIRVVYLMGVATLFVFAAMFAASAVFGSGVPELRDLAGSWRAIGGFSRANFGTDALVAVFAGMWIGAASHTFTDMAGSYVKTGRVTEFL